MLVNRHDYRIVGNAAFGVGHQLLNTSSFDQNELDALSQLLESRRTNFGDGVVAIDCGANIGVHTVELAKLMHGWGEVISFEAQERIFYALAGNIALNNCFNARAIWAAVGAESGEIRVPLPDYFVPSSFGSLEIRESAQNENIGQVIDYSPDSMIVTKMLAIDDLNLRRIDLIKIDIEGMEMDALRGARTSIERYSPQLLIEKIKSNEGDIQDFVAGFGYKTFPLGLNLLAIHASDPICPHIEIR